MIERSADELMFDVVDSAFLHGRRKVYIAQREWTCCGVPHVSGAQSARVSCGCGKGAWIVNLDDPINDGEM